MTQRRCPFVLLLIGHGTFDGIDAKFNLVWAGSSNRPSGSALLKSLAGRVVTVNASSASFPFLERLSAPRRIVITATDSARATIRHRLPGGLHPCAHRFDLPILDKNERISIWEAFAGASAGVRRHYQQRGQLSTERALLDDNGDGVGNEDTTPATTARSRAEPIST